MQIFVGVSLILFDTVIMGRIYDLFPFKPIAKIRLRFWLVIWLCGMGMDDHVEELLASMDKTTAAALKDLAFRSEGHPSIYHILFEMSEVGRNTDS